LFRRDAETNTRDACATLKRFFWFADVAGALTLSLRKAAFKRKGGGFLCSIASVEIAVQKGVPSTAADIVASVARLLGS